MLPLIGKAVRIMQAELGRQKLVLFDVFSGSGIVSRFFKQFAYRLYVNDLEAYSTLCSSCYLTNRSTVDEAKLASMLAGLKQRIEENWHSGFITELYAPKDESNIQKGERVFYTIRNAQYIDTARQEIALLPEEKQKFFLAPLLYGASVHNNTSGVFKGFYKNKEGIGQYGGSGRNALARIRGNIELQLPVFSNFECDVVVTQKDALQAALDMQEEVDLAYLDPPYNQHPYGSNYFMLNLILNYQRPDGISSVSGIPANWNHSHYNQRSMAQEALFRLVDNLRAKFILISYNSEGFVKYDDFVNHLTSLGELKILSQKYNTFRGSRNLRARDIHVKEFLFLLRRQ
ncbi:MAG: DNA adenine methylase [Victivallales bacterium]|nr:DNA adenine methylase [Victivallales bacterium]